MKSFLFSVFVLFAGHLASQDVLLESLLHSASDNQLEEVMRKPEQFQLQLIYTQIDRDENNHPSFRSYTYGLDTNLYFYPASTVKMPVAALALQKLNELGIEGVNKHSMMHTLAAREPQTSKIEDTTALLGKPFIAHYIKKIFLVSDNDAYNRLYEFLGQEYINHELYKRGYEQIRIVHRLSVSGFDTVGNRYTNPVKFYAEDDVLYQQEEVYSSFSSALRLKEQVRGVARMDNEGQILAEPFDFRNKNYASLQDLHDLLTTILFPESVSEGKSFDLTEEDYQLLWKYMSMLPRESKSPAYPEYADWDSYVKFLMFGDKKGRMPDQIRIFNKVGDAYGFLTDVAYIVDFENKVEFILAANIHVNKNQTYNDGVYEYDEIGLPMLAKIGKTIYQYELSRKRERAPDLKKFELLEDK
ncbi:MAG: class A beta-lactamase-related serine hydrolase [Chitinophagales bacterium]|nr:class A beta-lactamase-related serine hydrolase [Chitinophagales bacterium]